MNKISHLGRPSVAPSATLCSAQRYTPAPGEKRNLVLYDADTGEVLERYEADGREMPKKADWLKLYQSFASEISGMHDLSRIELFFLWHLLGRAGFGNQVEIKIASLATTFRCHRTSASRAVASLVRRRMIEKIDGRAYRLNPNFCWKGGEQFRRAQCERWAEKATKKSATA